MKKTINYFVLWRFALFIPLVVGFYYLPYRVGFEFTNIFSRIQPLPPLNHFLLFPWANFDGVHYLSIAGHGYVTEAAFFPLFPLLIRFVSQIFGKVGAFGVEQFFSGLFLANALFVACLCIFYQLLRMDYSKSISLKAVVAVLFFPTAFYFGSIYSESLFLLLILLSFYFARRRKWVLASLTGMLVAITRLVGVIVIIPLVYEYIVSESVKKRFQKESLLTILKSIKMSLVFLLVPTGLFGYLKFNQIKWGDGLYFIKAHANLANSRSVSSVVLFPQTMFRYIKILFSVPLSQFEWWVALLELGMFVGVSYLLYFAWKKKVRLSYLLFSVLAFLIPVSSGTFSGLPRYSIVLFPIYIALAGLLNTRKKKFTYMFVSGGLLFLLLMFFSRGYYIS